VGVLGAAAGITALGLKLELGLKLLKLRQLSTLQETAMNNS
jgi:hypothetical protein